MGCWPICFWSTEQYAPLIIQQLVPNAFNALVFGVNRVRINGTKLAVADAVGFNKRKWIIARCKDDLIHEVIWIFSSG